MRKTKVPLRDRTLETTLSRPGKGSNWDPPPRKGPGTSDWGTLSPVNGQTLVKTLPPVVLLTRAVTMKRHFNLSMDKMLQLSRLYILQFSHSFLETMLECTSSKSRNKWQRSLSLATKILFLNLCVKKGTTDNHRIKTRCSCTILLLLM